MSDLDPSTGTDLETSAQAAATVSPDGSLKAPPPEDWSFLPPKAQAYDGPTPPVPGVETRMAGNSGNSWLAQQRAPFKQELDENPDLKSRLAAIVSKENPQAGTGVVESLMNRTAYMQEHGHNVNLASMIGEQNSASSFYAPVRAGKVDSELAWLQQNPKIYQARLNNIDEALGGSNYTKGHTDQGSKGDPNYEAGGTGVNWNGERFNDWGYPGTAQWRQNQQAQAFGAQGDTTGLPTVPTNAPGNPAGPRKVGGFASRNAAYDAAPTNQQDYFLKQEPDESWSWTPNRQAPQDGTSPYYMPDIGDQFDKNAASSNSMFSQEVSGNQWGLMAQNLGPGVANGLGSLLDLPGHAVDAAMNGLTWLSGGQPVPFKFGGHAIGLEDYLNIPHSQVGKGWGADIGYGAGTNLGFSIPLIASGMGVAPLLGREAVAMTANNGANLATRGLGRYLLGFADHPISMPIQESMLALGAGAGGAEAHDVYTGATGRSGDVGDFVAQVLGGGVFNAARLGAFEAGKMGFKKAFGGANMALSKMSAEAHGMPLDEGFTGPGGVGRVVADPVTGRAIANNYLEGQFSAQMSNAERHFQAFGTVAPEDSAAYMADRMDTIRAGTIDFLKKTALEEKQNFANVPILPEGAAVRQAGYDAGNGTKVDGVFDTTTGRYLGHPDDFRGGVNLAMPRDYSATQQLFQQMKADHFEGTLRPTDSFPLELEKALFPGKANAGRVGEAIGEQTDVVPNYVDLNNPRGAQTQMRAGNTTETSSINAGTPQQYGLSAIDSLGRGQDVRSRINKMIDDEMSTVGRAQDPAYIGYLKKIRDSLLKDMTSAEGTTPAEIEAYRGAMAFAAERAKLVDTPEMQAILTGKNVDQALQTLLNGNMQGIQAGKVLAAVADHKYGEGGVEAAAKDIVRQKYVNSVAPNGYVSMRDHNAFMQRWGGLLSNQNWADVRTQLTQAAENEQSLLTTPGFRGASQPLGTGFPKDAIAQRLDRADLYTGAPLNTAMTYLENVQNPATATAELMRRLGTDPRMMPGKPYTEAQAGLMHTIAGKVITDPEYAVKNADMLKTIDQVNPGFSERALALSDVSTATGVLKRAVDLGASYVGAQFGGHIAAHTGSSMVMAGRFAQASRELAGTIGNNMAGIKSAMIVDPAVSQALARTVMLGGGAGTKQQMIDAMTLHAAIPGFYLSQLSNPAISGGISGTPAAAASGMGPAGKSWIPSASEVQQIQSQQGAAGPQPGQPEYGAPASKPGSIRVKMK